MAGRKLPSASDITKKTVDRARTAPADWESGLARASGTITSNMQAAGPRFADSMQKVLSQKLWDKAVAHLTDEAIIAAAKAVGGSTWLNGITTREDKIRRAWEILQPKLQAHMDKINGMKTITEADRTAKMVANLEGMRALGIRT